MITVRINKIKSKKKKHRKNKTLTASRYVLQLFSEIFMQGYLICDLR